MKRMVKTFFIPLMSILVLLAGCGSVNSNLEVSDVREIEVENGYIHSMSPDGKLIMSMDEEKMYFYEAETMDEVGDVSIDDIRGIDRGSIRWSPNSKYITFTQDFLRMMLEPDIYILDVEEGKIDNITDDDVEKFSFSEDMKSDVHVDILPMWTKDSKNIIYTRIVFKNDDRDTILYQIDLKGENEEKLASRSIGEGCNVVSLNPTDSAKKTYFTVMAPKLDDNDNGIWVMDDGKSRQTDYERENETVPAILTEVTKNGEYGIVYYPLPRPHEVKDTLFSIVKLKDGTEMPIKGDKAPKAEEPVWEFDTIFSPDGKSVLYLYGNNTKELYLALKTIDKSDENILWSEKNTRFLPVYSSPSILFWAKNNTILVAESNRGYIIELD